MVKNKKQEAVLIRAELYCPKTKSRVIADKDELSFSGQDYQCESCGTHGSVMVHFKCTCGSWHKIELSSW